VNQAGVSALADLNPAQQLGVDAVVTAVSSGLACQRPPVGASARARWLCSGRWHVPDARCANILCRRSAKPGGRDNTTVMYAATSGGFDAAG
jgi:hypothetical protein